MRTPAFPGDLSGGLHAWLFILLAIAIALVIAYIAHRTAMALLPRLARHRPFTTGMVSDTWSASRTALMVFAIRMVLSGTPDDIPLVRPISYLTTVALILALTWLAMRCVQSIANTMGRLHPVDVADNLRARRIMTQTRVLSRSAYFLIGVIGLSFVLLTLPGARQFGASLLASAGVAGLVAGIAARPVLGNFIAGLQLAFTQPIRLDDVLIVHGEWGRVEEITSTFVVVRIWDERRLIVPLQWFIENPFENWTHRSASILGTVYLWLDFAIPTAPLRQEFERITKSSDLWDGRVCVLQVTDTSERTMQIRLLVSAKDSGTAFDLRCLIREGMIAYIARNYPEGLPRLRSTLDPVEVRSSGPARPDSSRPDHPPEERPA